MWLKQNTCNVLDILSWAKTNEESANLFYGNLGIEQTHFLSRTIDTNSCKTEHQLTQTIPVHKFSVFSIDPSRIVSTPKTVVKIFKEQLFRKS